MTHGLSFFFFFLSLLWRFERTIIYYPNNYKGRQNTGLNGDSHPGLKTSLVQAQKLQVIAKVTGPASRRTVLLFLRES